MSLMIQLPATHVVWQCCNYIGAEVKRAWLPEFDDPPLVHPYIVTTLLQMNLHFLLLTRVCPWTKTHTSLSLKTPNEKLDHSLYQDLWHNRVLYYWGSTQRNNINACIAKGEPSFLTYFKTLSNGAAPGIKPTTSRSTVKRSTNWANPTTVLSCQKSLECKQSIVLHFLDSLFLNRQWYTPFAPPPTLCRTAYSPKHLKTIAHAKFVGGGGVNKVYYKGFTNSHLGSMYVAN